MRRYPRYDRDYAPDVLAVREQYFVRVNSNKFIAERKRLRSQPGLLEFRTRLMMSENFTGFLR